MKKINVRKTPVYPFIDSLVDSLFTKEINDILESENVKEDKNTFLMFITIYFTTRLYADNSSASKDNIKNFMTELIRNKDKRKKCIELFYQMNNVIQDKELQLTWPTNS